MENVDSVQPVSSGCCIFCSAQASLVCHRCGDFYCSKKCQLKDWQRHRYICFAIPALVHPLKCSAFGNGEAPAAQQMCAKLTENVAAFQTSSNKALNWNKKTNKNETSLKITSPPFVAMPSNGSNVYIMSFRTINRCFVRDSSKAAEEEYSNICCKINLLGRKQPKLQKLKFSGFALAELNGLMQRVKILGSQTGARLLFIDKGILKHRSGVEMREISSELLELPCHVLELHLKDVPNYMMHNEVNPLLKKFEGEEYFATIDCSNHIELYCQKHLKSVNAQIRDFCSNTPIYGAASPALGIKAKGANQTNSKDNSQKNVESKSEANAIKTTVQEILNCDESEHNVAELKIIAKPFENIFNKNQSAIAKPEQRTEIKSSNKLDLDSYISEGKSLKNVSSNNEKMDPILDASVKTDEILTTSTSFIEKPLTIASNSLTKANIDPVLNAPFEVRRFSSIDNNGFDAFIVVNESVARGIFGAFDSIYARDFTDLQCCLSKFNDTEPYRPVVKEYVIAKLKGGWYRARVMDIKTNQSDCTYNVVSLEFTYAATITHQDIRRYPADLTVPCHTNICLIEGFPHRPTNEQIKFLQQKLQVHSLLHIDGVNYLQDMALVKCKALLDELNEIS